MGDSIDKTQGTKDKLYVASRAQMNFAENVPLAIAIAALAEVNGANRYVSSLIRVDAGRSEVVREEVAFYEAIELSV